MFIIYLFEWTENSYTRIFSLSLSKFEKLKNKFVYFETIDTFISSLNTIFIGKEQSIF